MSDSVYGTERTARRVIEILKKEKSLSLQDIQDGMRLLSKTNKANDGFNMTDMRWHGAGDSSLKVYQTAANSPTPTIDTDLYGLISITGQSVAITSFTTNLIGNPTHGKKLVVQITGTGSISLAWGAKFESSTVTLPTTTVGTEMLSIGFLYNGSTSRWCCVAVS